MPAPFIYRSTDAGAAGLLPSITLPGALVSILDACLVNGYGGTFGSGTLTSDGTNVADGDTFTIGSQVYTFKSAIGTTAYNVLIGASAAASLTNLSQAINGTGTAGTTYPTGTNPNPDVWATNVTSTAFTLQARAPGSGGNKALAATSAHLTVSGAAMTGGGGTNSVTPAGWTISFTGPNQRVYRAPGGNGFTLYVDDRATDAFPTGAGWVTSTGLGAGTNPFGSSYMKRATVWLLAVDDRTLYWLSGSAGNMQPFVFGDIYSLLATDAYASMCGGLSGKETNSNQYLGPNGGTLTLARGVSQSGASVGYTVGGYSSSGAPVGGGQLVSWLNPQWPYPNPADSGLHLSRISVNSGGAPGLRGYFRGLWLAPHNISAFSSDISDPTYVNGSGAFAGRTFMMVGGTATAVFAIETTAWDHN